MRSGAGVLLIAAIIARVSEAKQSSPYVNGSGGVPPHVRASVIRDVARGGASLAAIARAHGVSRYTVYGWPEFKHWKATGEVPEVPKYLEHRTAETVTRTKRNKLGEAPDPLAAHELNSWARRGLDDFAYFRSHYIGRDSPPWATEAANKLLELYYSEQEEYLVLNVAPGAGKSTLVTHDFVIWCIARERALGHEPTIQLGHRATQKALWYVGRVGSTLQNNYELVMDYGRFKPLKARSVWSREELFVEPLDWTTLTEKEPTVSAAAYDASLLSGRFKLIIWDDLVDKANSLSVEQRQKLIEWWEVEAETRLEPRGLLVLSGARYGPDDLFHHLYTQKEMEDDDDEDNDPRDLYERVIYPAHFEENCDGHDHTKVWPEGCLLDPNRISWRKIKRFKVKDEGRFRLVWQQEDIDPQGFLADPKWFTGGTDSRGEEVPGCFDPDRIFGQVPRGTQLPYVSALSVDPAPANYWGIQHWVTYGDQSQYLVRGARRKLQAPELLYHDQGGNYTGILEEWWQLAQEAGMSYTWLVVEVNTANRWLLQYPFVAEWALARGITIVRHTTGVNKADPDKGVQMLGPLYRQGLISIPYGGYQEKLYADAFSREACSWPEGSTSDQVMAHWFFNSNLKTMQIAEMQELDDGRDTAPAWSYQRAMPRWAQKSLSGRRG